MTCKQLGGACDQVFEAETFEEMTELSKQHGMEMFKAGEPAHLHAMEAMNNLMQNPTAMRTWFDERRKEFETL